MTDDEREAAEETQALEWVARYPGLFGAAPLGSDRLSEDERRVYQIDVPLDWTGLINELLAELARLHAPRISCLKKKFTKLRVYFDGPIGPEVRAAVANSALKAQIASRSTPAAL